MKRFTSPLIAAVFATGLLAQGGIDHNTPQQPPDPTLPKTTPPTGRDNAPVPANESGLRPVLSALDFDITLGGGLEIELKSAQHEGGNSPLDARSSAHRGLDLDKAYLSLGIDFRKDIRAKVEFEASEDDALLDEAYVTFVNPLIGFELIPRLSDDVRDNLLIGLEDPFWRNDKRIGESYSLLQESLARDERMQLLYTVTLFDKAYVMGGLSNGLALALDGSVDETRNFPILQDDRGTHFAGFDDEDNASRRMETIAGAGLVFDLKDSYETSVFPRDAAFRPMDLQRLHKDFLHLGVWLTHDRLSADEKALLAGGSPTDTSDQKWRLGIVAEAIFETESNVLAARAEYAHAVDGPLERNLYSIEASIMLPIARFRFARSVTPFARYSAIATDIDVPAVGVASTQADVDRALIAASRRQLAAGVSVEVSRSVRLIVEYVSNGEDFDTIAPLSSKVDNDLWLLALHVEW